LLFFSFDDDNTISSHLNSFNFYYSNCMTNYNLFLQGDILFLHMSKDPIRAGEIVVFNVDVSF